MPIAASESLHAAQNGLAFPGDGEISQVVATDSSTESTQSILAMLEVFFS